MWKTEVKTSACSCCYLLIRQHEEGNCKGYGGGTAHAAWPECMLTYLKHMQMTHFTYLPSDIFNDFFKSSNFFFLYLRADGMGLWFHNSSDFFFSRNLYSYLNFCSCHFWRDADVHKTLQTKVGKFCKLFLVSVMCTFVDDCTQECDHGYIRGYEDTAVWVIKNYHFI